MAAIRPIIIIIVGSSFCLVNRCGSFIGINRTQFIVAPMEIAIEDNRIIGVDMLVFSSFRDIRGENIGGDHTSLINIRVE